MQKIKEFLQDTQYEHFTIEVASSDASFRRYFRLNHENETLVLMDSSLEKSSLEPFIEVTNLLESVNLHAPKIIHEDTNQGFLILEDLGSQNLLDNLNQENFKSLYKECIDEIITMQDIDASELPLYDEEFLKLEMNLMPEWFLKKYLEQDLNDQEMKTIKNTLDIVAKKVLAHPQGSFVHRDFHSRNIMHCSPLGIIDYQDAMNGSIVYDLVSLLKDLYIQFDPQDMNELALYFKEQKELQVSDEEFLEWFDFMGLQRHLKVLGIFARLSLRDGKDGYLKDLPLTLEYVLQVCKKYPELDELNQLLSRVTLP
ncbi:phosphotransferase [Arcobacteraceae bacterium]|nr:phosphotransferase [Arcobacteraceae bacterium]